MALQLDGHRDGRRDRPGPGDAGGGAPGRARGGDEPGPAQARGERRSQVARAWAGRTPTPTRAATRPSRPRCARPVLDALADLRARYDVVVCEGAGSPAEINLRAGDIANMGLARAAGPAGRGRRRHRPRRRVRRRCYGTVALLEPDDQALVAGFVDQQVPRRRRACSPPGSSSCTALTGRPTLGVLPWLDGLWLDAEDSLALEAPRRAPAPPAAATRSTSRSSGCAGSPTSPTSTRSPSSPGCGVRFTRSPADVERADLVVLPARRRPSPTSWLRARRPRPALARRAAAGGPILGICGGYQMLGDAIDDDVEGRRGTVAGLGLLPGRARGSPPTRCSAARRGTALAAARRPPATRSTTASRRVDGGEPLIDEGSASGEGCAVGAVLGTSWHGLLESDDGPPRPARVGGGSAAAGAGGRGPSPSPRSASATSTASARSSRSTRTWARWRR